MVILVVSIINYTKKSLKSHDLSDFSLGEIFYSPFFQLLKQSFITGGKDAAGHGS